MSVRPLLEIFRRFKFTLTENTPIEEEVALDPELLGHVFENLLAAYVRRRSPYAARKYLLLVMKLNTPPVRSSWNERSKK